VPNDPTQPVEPFSPEALGGREANERVDDKPSMRDPFRNMFRASRVLEGMFFESQQRAELVVSPIAIYRSFTLTALEAP
jgi:hypothetical protein